MSRWTGGTHNPFATSAHVPERPEIRIVITDFCLITLRQRGRGENNS